MPWGAGWLWCVFRTNWRNVLRHKEFFCCCCWCWSCDLNTKPSSHSLSPLPLSIITESLCLVLVLVLVLVLQDSVGLSDQHEASDCCSCDQIFQQFVVGQTEGRSQWVLTCFYSHSTWHHVTCVWTDGDSPGLWQDVVVSSDEQVVDV